MMDPHRIRISDFEIGNDRPLVLMAGPCVIESEDFTLRIAESIRDIATKCGIPLIFKSSFDKANRTSKDSFRGPGLEEGLRILKRVKDEVGVPVITDVHTPEQAEPVAKVADVLQTPAFLCRQTDFIEAVAKTGKPVNIKKGQFLAPWDMRHVLDKALATGNQDMMLCERGVSFGYNNLVSDMRSLLVMRDFGAPVVFDATHSVQQPGGLGGATGGNREFVPGLARAAVATGVAAVFMEVHPDPDQALSDGPNSLALGGLEDLLKVLKRLDEVVKKV
ncbi:MAG: 3-deoxy-8-phosphooctulonate synthase [Zetaproteobacteria bacterium]|nr:MAG: 3-deoxy-8-phosphooctulonate synthase [Zetaproteobacteria bacterium]